MASLTSRKALAIALRYCATACSFCASATSTCLPTRPAPHNGCVRPAAKFHTREGPLNRLRSDSLSLPSRPVSEIEGKYAARATPIRAVAAISRCSAAIRSGRFNNSSECSAGGSATVFSGVSFGERWNSPSKISRGERPSSTFKARSSLPSWLTSGGNCARAASASAARCRKSNSEMTPASKRFFCMPSASSLRAIARRVALMRASNARTLKYPCTVCADSDRRMASRLASTASRSARAAAEARRYLPQKSISYETLSVPR